MILSRMCRVWNSFNRHRRTGDGDDLEMRKEMKQIQIENGVIRYYGNRRSCDGRMCSSGSHVSE